MFPPFLEEAPAKINLALHVLGRRNDGYHELDSIVAFADIADTLLFEPSVETRLSVTGPHAAGLVAADNLVQKALDALSQHVKLKSMRITLNKNLPLAAGLGGGSADAAAALRGALRASEAYLPPETLAGIALSIGADVPVCMLRKASRMRGIGEQLSEATAPASAIVLVNPGIPCDTSAVFAALGLAAGAAHKDQLDPANPASWRNDLTDAAIAVQPVISDVLQVLAAEPRFTAVRMSGSGATCFGLIPDLESAVAVAYDIARNRPRWWVRAATLT